MSLQKPRLPGSIEDALARVCGVLGFDEAGALLGHASGSRLRQCADPEQDAQIHLRDAIKLDRRYCDTTGDAPPLLTVYAELLGPRADAAAHVPQPLDRRMLQFFDEAGELARDLAKANADARISPREHAKLAKDLRDLGNVLARFGRDLDHAAKNGGR
jgi:hypothetical protein